MAVKFHTLEIDSVQKVTADAVAISLKVPEELKPVFLYSAGQYITIKIDVDGVSHRRNYSLCSSPVYDEPLTIAVKRVSDGVVSSWLTSHLHPGLTLEVYPPMGNFTKEMHKDHVRHYLLIAGGSGITPILSILKSILRIEPKSVATLFYANRNSDQIIFDAEISQLVEKHPNALHVVHVLEEESPGRTPYQGRLDSEMIERLVDTYVPSFDSLDVFICGPQAMMDIAVAYMHANGVDDRHIHREYFTISKESMDVESTTNTTSDTEIITRRVKIKLYGKVSEFDVNPDETILSAAQRVDLDPPYACQIGACCTCRARLVSGTAIMDEREALSDDEIADGYVLTCQAHPTSDGVMADYDQ